MKKKRTIHPEEILVGWVMPCLLKQTNTYNLAQIEQVKPGDEVLFYVHYIDFDRRLDSWVTINEMNTEKIKKKLDLKYMKRKKITRSNKREFDDLAYQDTKDHEDDEEGHVNYPKNIEGLILGNHYIDCWYYSPYPEEIIGKKRKIYLCEYCLRYMKKKKTLKRHLKRCKLRHPPGDEIYRDKDAGTSFFEINGSSQRFYCQNLCLLAKIFLEEKNIYCDVDGFVFYVLTKNDSKGCHIMGYFSKEKNSLNNLACIMTLPPYQRQGLGSYLISFSYELSKIENKLGSPERPLSDLGALGYQSYWKFVLMEVFRKHGSCNLSVKDIASITAMTHTDIVETFERLNLVKFEKGTPVLYVPKELMDSHFAKLKRLKMVIIPDKIHYTYFDYQFKYLDNL